ncbi:protein kinase domain-containing protein [Laspinema palackyanum]|uniref:protein kinase domain-containing protein n=1 Tax=Laspinema palackyanum TaxID=3231601 RepID=UPI00345DE0EA|nr:serine/threonine protein kinase [Laspinema sp. D2c]
MTHCLNPNCPKPQNPDGNLFCQSCGAKLRLESSDHSSPTGCYRALQQIGAGGFSKTYLAVDESQPLKPPCIIKQFRPSPTADRPAIELFREEVDRLKIISNHPQIPNLLAWFEQGDRHYFVQNYIPGTNLATELAEQGTFSESQIRELLEAMLPLLHFIHHHRLIHRDIKPENIIRHPHPNQGTLSRGQATKLVLVDFGGSKYATETTLAQLGTTIGSAEYTAPEQLRGQARFASDLYSLAVTCIHLLTQMSPFDLWDSLEGRWVWRDYLLNPVSDGLANILDKMLLESLSKRYASAEVALKELNPKIQLQMPEKSAISKGKVVMVSQYFPPIQNSPPPEQELETPSPSPLNSPPAPVGWNCVQTIAQTGGKTPINAVAFSAQSRAIASGNDKGVVALWDLETGELVQQISASEQGILSIAIASDGQILASGSMDGTVKLWSLWQLSPKDLRDGIPPIPTQTFTGHTSLVSSVAICPDKQRVATGSRDRTVKIWSIATGQLQFNLTGHRDRVTCVAYNPKWATSDPGRSHLLASGSADGSIHLWQADTGELLQDFPAHSGAIHALAIGPDGKTLISCSWDRTLKIWTLPTATDNYPELRETLCPHVLPGSAVAISSNRKTFATASHDTTIKLWTLDTIEPVATLSGHSMTVSSLAYSPDGTTLASASHDGTIKLWRNFSG